MFVAKSTLPDSVMTVPRGSSFTVAAIAVMGKLYTLTEVGFGAVPGPNQPWEPKTVLALDDYLEKVKRGR